MEKQTLNITPLNRETRTGLPTKEAAAQLARQAQTLRTWAMTGKGPIQPRRINGRLSWPVEDLKRLLGVA